MIKHFDSNNSLQQKLLQGIDVLADNVASTLGPRGRNVILHQKGSSPIITKDGVTVARFIELEDEFQNVGAQILKQASEQTNNLAGDGTTTATVLARAIYRESQKYIVSGASPVEMKRGMDAFVEKLVEGLKDLASPVSSMEDISNIATISANGDKVIGSLIATAIDKAGKDGAITIEEARSMETSLDIVEGFRLPSGYISPQFVTDDRRGAVKYDNCFVLVTDSKIETVDEIYPTLEVVAREGRPFLIVAESVEGQALAALIMNALRGTMKVAAIKAPYYGEQRRETLKDLALSMGATFISRESGISLSDVTLEHLGKVNTVDITKTLTTLIGGSGSDEDIEEKIDILKEELKNTEDLTECETIQDRITRLASGIAIIRVGAATEVEMIEKKYRLEDALEAVKAAQAEGIVPGGGVALIRAAANINMSFENTDQLSGAKTILEAIKEPVLQMARNSDLSPDIIYNMVANTTGNAGFNFSTQKMVENLVEGGIVDPLKVTIVALQNATSVASMLITTNHGIIEAQ